MMSLPVLLGTSILSAQTNVTGGIYSNTTWTKANSPYHASGQIVLFPGNTLTIEPGVTVLFDTSAIFEIRGTLIAIGQENDSIIFTSSAANLDDTKFGQWSGIKVSNNLGGSAEVRLARISYGTTGVLGVAKVTRSKFTTNYVGVKGSSPEAIDSCVFSRNMRGVEGSGRITNSYFGHTMYFAVIGSSLEIEGNTFVENDVAVDGYGTVRNNFISGSREGVRGALLIEENTFMENELAIGNGGTIRNNFITDNEVGIKVSTGDISCNVITRNGIGFETIDNGNGTSLGFMNNIIYDNTTYNFVNGTPESFDATNNCWGTTDSSAIAAKIFDGYDDPSKGLASFFPAIPYTPGAPVGNCQIVTALPSDDAAIEPARLYPNPMSDHAILTAGKELKNASVMIINLLGEVVQQKAGLEGKEFSISRDGLPTGIYLVQLRENGKSVTTVRMIVL